MTPEPASRRMSSGRSASTSPNWCSIRSSPATSGSGRRRALASPLSITTRTAPAPTPISSWPRRWPPVAERPKGMGRGIPAALSAPPRGEPQEPRPIPVEMVDPSPNQPRHAFDEDSLVSLAGSIRASGVLQPVLVRPLPDGRFELIAGERRWRAAQLAGLETIPALVRARDDAESLELALIENMAREDLNPVEEARACAALVEELGLSREQVGVRVGRSRVAVSNLLRLLDLPDEALELLERGVLSEGHGRALLIAADHGARGQLARSAAEAGWSVRELESRARAANDPSAETVP